MSSVITGLFENASQATLAIYRLEAMGVNEADISIVANNSYTKEDFAVDEGTKAAEGGIVGATSGGVLAAIIGGFTAVGTVASGGVGLLVAGPLVAAFAAGGAGAAVGGTLGAAIGAFIPEHEIKYYEDAIEKGSILVGVKYNSDNKNSIEELLENAGATNVSKA
ncbi:general stress protein [Pseudoalteromonas sp. ZZD1]|uniref:general stress protein n=1 Tax=Pseudoalteromonas sp. ZZD1 TaxID=3139395 RepID=UPI003BA854DA